MTWKQFIVVLLMVLIVGGITFISEFLAKRESPEEVKAKENKESLFFTRTSVQWDTDGYVKEYEPFREGHYDFPVLNRTSAPRELGLADNGCDCSRILFAPLSKEQWQQFQPERIKLAEPNVVPSDMMLEWQGLTPNAVSNPALEPSAGGVVRLVWHGRKNPGSDLNLSASIWDRAKGAVEKRTTRLQVPLVMSFPINFAKLRHEQQDKDDVGALGPRKMLKTEYQLWSPTRDAIEVTLKTDHLPKNVAAWIKPMNASEAQALEVELRKEKFNTRVRWAARLQIQIHETKDGEELPIAPFQFQFPLVMDDFPLELPVPQVRGRVLGDIEIGAEKDGGKINLNLFSSQEGTEKTVPLWTPERAELTVERVISTNENIRARLTKIPEESMDGKARWNVNVKVAPNGPLGELDATLLLQLKSTPTSPPRQIRIPIMGTAAKR
jgi:hypothetical protein